jgi:hypothetical protein
MSVNYTETHINTGTLPDVGFVVPHIIILNQTSLIEHSNNR